MINNFHVIDNFLQFEEGTFYKFELLVTLRKTADF